MDDLDRRILMALLENPRASHRSIAKTAGTTPPTAIARLQRLVDLGALQGFQAVVAPWALDSAMTPLPMAPDRGAPRCHQCHGALPDAPVEQRIDGRHHWFCCTVCRDTMAARSSQLQS